MNINIDAEITKLDRLREIMGAPMIETEPSIWEKLQNRGGIELKNLNQLTVCNDGTFEFNGHKVLLYIRDQREKFAGDYRFHIANCETIQEFRANGRIQRYVVSNRTDGVFMVNILSYNRVIEQNVEKKLLVCKNCLHRINYKGYDLTRNFNRNDQIFETFQISEFFRLYPATLNHHLDHTGNLNAPVNVYPDNWEEISHRTRAFRNWICEDCKTNFNNERNKLHVHHINGLKDDTKTSNLKVLCHKCHQNYHTHDLNVN